MLYTVVPLECIYATPYRVKVEQKEKETEEQEAQYREVLLQHGRIVTRRNGEDYIIERINSTNMGDYLNEGYNPGKKFTE